MRAWKRAGVRCGLGSDGAACNNRLDTFAEMGLAAGLARVQHRDDEGSVTEYDISGEWRTVTVNDGLSAALGEAITADTSIETLRKLCAARDIALDPAWGRGQVILEMYEHLLEDVTILPTFYKDFPTDVAFTSIRACVNASVAE